MLASTVVLHADPNRYGHSDRVERHMLPVVSTGPTDPAWSPDGKAIAFAMRGDVWTIPADGGTAVALTQGPAYHFEPAWSPDGKRIALTMDVGGNLDVGIVSAEGGAVQRITTNPDVDVEPTWSADGRSLYYVTTHGGERFVIVRHDLDDGTDHDVVAGIEPAVSPDGRSLAYVAPVPGLLGTGGIWVKPLPDGEPRLVHYEETEYRARPRWTPDGQAIVFVSDEGGSNDVMLVPAVGGNPVRLTVDARDEYTPSMDPSGDRLAFVSNRAGATVLYTAPASGGPAAAWRAVPVRALAPRVPDGRLHVRVLDASGRPTPARLTVEASDGRAYAPAGGFHRVIAATETHYFHTGTGDADVEVPNGRVVVEAVKGFEYRPARATVDVPAGGTRPVTLRLARRVDAPARGWWSGDTHIHDLHQGMYGLTHETFVDQLRAEDLHVTNALIHMDGTRLMGRWEDLTGRPQPLSTPGAVLQYGEEYRGSLGHVSLLGIGAYVLPLVAGERGTPYAQPELDDRWIDGAHAQGGLAGFGHPYLRAARPADVASTLIPVDVALGRGDFYDVTSLYSDELASTDVYYRLLNCGFRLPATGGTDNFSDAGRDPPPGSDRTYVRLDGSSPPTVRAWLDGIRAQHTFSTTGPLLFLDVAGHEPGDEIALGSSAPTALRVRVDARSIAPMARLDVVVNGSVALTVPAVDSAHLALDTVVDVPKGGWVAARVVGPASRYIGDSYAFAQTSPVYVVRGGRRWTSAADARFLAESVDAIRARVERGPWRTAAERERFMAELDRARAVYERIAAENDE